MLSQLLFAICLATGIWMFTRKVKEISANIRMGRPLDRNDQPSLRWKTMAMVALGQSKMFSRPLAAFFHLIIYVGFIIVNVELIEIVIDGLFGTHRVLSFLGGFYNFLIGSFEFLAFGVLLACVVFLCRRNILRLKRFHMRELTSWPRTDANLILITEILLMSAFLFMNASDYLLQKRAVFHDFEIVGAFPVSGVLTGLLSGLSNVQLEIIERGCWWFHIIGILAFLNYVPYSKHFHILLAFPNTYYSNLQPKGKFTNMPNVTREVKLMLDPSSVSPEEAAAPPTRFGAKDVTDLTWKQLMDAYSCTECGRCTSNCPANITGKLLSPRKIMMDTRDRMEEIGRRREQKIEAPAEDGKALLGDYILPEELWACTSCNACTETCPVNIDPLSIILDLRRFMVMEQSAAPNELNGMFTRIENNGAPWQFSPADRMNWVQQA